MLLFFANIINSLDSVRSSLYLNQVLTLEDCHVNCTFCRRQQVIAKPHYLSNVEHVHPMLRTELELQVQDLNDFMIKKLRGLLYEAKKLARKQKQVVAAWKKEGKTALCVHVCVCVHACMHLIAVCYACFLE